MKLLLFKKKHCHEIMTKFYIFAHLKTDLMKRTCVGMSCFLKYIF